MSTTGMDGREDRRSQQESSKGKPSTTHISDEQLEALDVAVRKAPIGVGTFLAGMMLDSVRHEKNLQRWKEGGLPEGVDQNRLAQIYSKDFPQHVAIAKESLAGITTGSARSYGLLDQVADAIATAITERLPRRIDAYRYGQNGAVDEIEISGLGKITVKMSQSGNGVFSYISSIEGENFRIWNCRQTGRQYRGRYNDIARPSEIVIDPLDTEIHLYDDDSGIFLKTRGLEYTNSRVNVFGIGYRGDSRRDDMYPSRRGFQETKSEDILAVLREKNFLGVDSFDGKERFRDWNFRDVTRNPRQYEQFVTDLGRPFKLSWTEISNNAARWLEQEVLAKITAVSANVNQADVLPEPIPYPEKAGTLYTWVSFRKAEKIGGDASRVRVEEKDAIPIGWRLVSLGTGGDYPSVANNGFIWCGIGEPSSKAKAEDYMIPGHQMDSDFGDYRNKLVKVTPKHGEDIYVVDYQVWDNYREAAFKQTDRLSDAQVAEMHAILARTIVPINQYKGDYRKPVVLVGRGLGLDEVQVVPGIVYGE